MFVYYILNNKLKRMREIESYEEGLEVIKMWVKEFKYYLYDEDYDTIANEGEYCNYDDEDEIITFGINSL